MEKIVKKLFDYQHFENNEHLAKIIDDVESLYKNELSDADLEFVNAAGTVGEFAVYVCPNGDYENCLSVGDHRCPNCGAVLHIKGK